MLPEDATFIRDLRQKVSANTQQGLPPHTGIDRDELKRAIELSRKSYQANQLKSKASGVSAPGPALDLDALFKGVQKKSG